MNKNKKIGLSISIGILLLIILFFLIVEPPIEGNWSFSSSYGHDISFHGTKSIWKDGKIYFFCESEEWQCCYVKSENGYQLASIEDGILEVEARSTINVGWVLLTVDIVTHHNDKEFKKKRTWIRDLRFWKYAQARKKIK